MADGTTIEWARHPVTGRGATWNPVRGCTRVSPGCGGPGKAGGCYAEKIAARFSDPGQPFHGFAERRNGEARWTGKVALVDNLLTLPLRWKEPRGIFVNSMSDLFHEGLPNEVIDRVFAVMALAPHHVFFPLTKRVDRMLAYLSDEKAYERVLRAAEPLRAERPALGSVPISDPRHGGFWPHVWPGVSVERQTEADLRRPALAAIAAMGWRTFVSYEPALGPVDWTGFEFLSWLISGGESGKAARPSHPDWHRLARDFAVAHRIPYLMKQWGEWASGFRNRMGAGDMVFRQFTSFEQWVNKASTWVNGGICLDVAGNNLRRGADFMAARDEGRFPVTILHRVGKKAAGRTLDGRTWDEFPEVRP